MINLSVLNAQDFDAYKFYNKKSKEVSPKDLIRDLAGYDVVLIGEHHDNSINHWLEKRITEALFEKKKGQVILGAEMFERDNQPALYSYLAGKIEAKNLKDSVRLWKNYETDYRPLLDFAKEKKLSFIATNVPRKSLMGDHVDEMKLMNFVSAQAVKDATMAESIFLNLRPGTTFIHYSGDYHSKQYGGIYWYLKKKNPNLKIAVISVFESEKPVLSLPEKDFLPTEFNLIIPADMAKTY